jgi:hypothetical protein
MFNLAKDGGFNRKIGESIVGDRNFGQGGGDFLALAGFYAY